MNLAECEEIRLQVLRGDGVIGILPAARVTEMVAAYRELAQSGQGQAWLGLAHYHMDPNGLDPSPLQASQCAARAIEAGQDQARSLLVQLLPAVGGSQEAPARMAYQCLQGQAEHDPDGSIHYLLGLMTFHGFGCSADASACAVFHREAAQRGDRDAMFELYVLYSTGTGLDRDSRVAMDWCRKAAELKQMRACYNLGAAYATGRGCPKDEQQSLYWYEEASRHGHGRASATLAVMLRQQNPSRARLFRDRAEEQGFDVESFLEQLGLKADF